MQLSPPTRTKRPSVPLQLSSVSHTYDVAPKMVNTSNSNKKSHKKSGRRGGTRVRLVRLCKELGVAASKGELDLARKLVEYLREQLGPVYEEYLARFSIRSKVGVPNPTGPLSTSVTEISRNSGSLPSLNADSSDSDDSNEWIEVPELPTEEVQEIHDYISNSR